MKELFKTTENFLNIEIEGKIFGIFSLPKKEWHFVDCNGNKVDYQRPVLPEEYSLEGQYTDDPTQIDVVSEGYYPFSTHPIDYSDVDAPNGTGIIKIKNLQGDIVAEE